MQWTELEEKQPSNEEYVDIKYLNGSEEFNIRPHMIDLMEVEFWRESCDIEKTGINEDECLCSVINTDYHDNWCPAIQREIRKNDLPVNIKDKQPTMGQRCLVYEFRYKEWVFAYWQREHKTGTYLFEEWRMGKHRNVDAEYWLPEPSKPTEAR